MYTFHVFLITIFFSPHMSLKKSLNLTCDVPKSLLFKVNSVGNPGTSNNKRGLFIPFSCKCSRTLEI